MRARIRLDNGGCYVGEVYGIWSNWIFGTEWTGWNRVTSRCTTTWGAKAELKRWQKENCPKEFTM